MALKDFQPGPWQHVPHSVHDIETKVDQDLRIDDQDPKNTYSKPTPAGIQRPSNLDLVAEDRPTISTSNPSLPILRSTPSTSSISSTTSTSSTTTTQTFVSTLSFSTITGPHLRDEHEADDQLDLDSLEVAILTPTENRTIPFFDQEQTEQDETAESDRRLQEQEDAQPQTSVTAASGRYTKTPSQYSTGAVTVKRLHSAEPSRTAVSSLTSPPSSSPSSIVHSMAPHEQEEAVQEMLFASPEYRKSIALSEHSELMLDPSSPSGRISSLCISDTAPQYTNLLRDAAMIIEQRHPDCSETQDHNDAISIDAEHANVRLDNNSISPEELAHDVKLRESMRTPEKESSSTTGTPSSSTRSTITKSRSRRFSAPGHHGSSHVSLSSLTRSSEASSSSQAAGTEILDVETLVTSDTSVRGPQAIQLSEIEIEHAEPKFFLPGVRPGMNTVGLEGTASRHAAPLLQHHATIQPYLPMLNDSLKAGPSAPSTSAALHLSHLHHDYRPGVVFEYYEGEWDWLPNFDEMRPDNAGIVGNFMIDDTTEQELFRPRYSHQVRRKYKESGNFAVRFTTHIDITQDGVYSFWLSSNDGSVLYVANTLVVENDGMHYTTEAEGRISLHVGRHPITVEFFHRNGKMLEGFRSTGPSLVVSYRAPGPLWSFGLKAGPKKIIKSANLFYDHGDIRLRNLLRDYGVDDYSSMDNINTISPTGLRPNEWGADGRDLWGQGAGGNQQRDRPSRYRMMSGDMGPMQPSNRELHVQMENAKTTIKDLEQIIQDQAESHKKKMAELYSILQDTQAQVDRLLTGLKKAALFEAPRKTVPQNQTSHQSWRNTVMSVYVDAEEDYPQPGPDQPGTGEDDSVLETDGDDILAKHLADVEKLKELYFFSMALSVKMNSEMMGKKTPEYTSTSVQKLYEDCTGTSKVPVEGWPGYVSRHFARRPTT
ncbi:hypothetical protein BC939DRAFT_507996 [Gamsiella multidivaricata]|uniref:uncharacterized protein n=1 Tax=Gamsiella multidivaricata TaxID=101098 RepID=UPI002220B0BA|nr:uncharacterized protein BC939DRAFT_507996 [Gamsiella multidivaricata]KAI7816784.1 hypothetical protein BC939DRAFT_507996 [Gamsiella multidivaricata]